MIVSELDRLRLRGIDILAICGWACTAWLALLGWMLNAPDTAAVVFVSAAANVLPSFMALQRRHDENARLIISTLAMIEPALAILLLSGHPWQMDGHMYFFVALAALTILCDWKPIALASTLIALHHLVLGLFAPGWVFGEVSAIGRVMVHAVAVILQCAILCYLTVYLRALMTRQVEATGRSAELATEAVERRREVEAALDAANSAKVLTLQERDRHRREEDEATEFRRSEMLVLATAFQTSVANAVQSVGAAATELEGTTQLLNELARRASQESCETAEAASRSSSFASSLAGRTEDLSRSISVIANTVDQQAQLSSSARGLTVTAHGAVAELAARTHSISGFAQSIGEIASRTNLLALNAAIEAARAGEAGKGFSIVAGEVKQLASQASGATGEIRGLAGSVQGSASLAQDGLEDIRNMVVQLAEAAQAIRVSVGDQRVTADAIEETARETAAEALRIVAQIGDVVSVASDTEMLSERVSHAATGLSATAQTLKQEADRFIMQLNAA